MRLRLLIVCSLLLTVGGCAGAAREFGTGVGGMGGSEAILITGTVIYFTFYLATILLSIFAIWRPRPVQARQRYSDLKRGSHGDTESTED